ncbi:hypothetical protein IEQ34_020263 [Dendrobium chrysotoxum]|uniref:Uncharacterized protein n=1 Tax=Dendrobium chrysotoxum TaxID=161865 RepID=A0AAV7G0G5_DENCH|nr:hypothetical protein IEQ34_020263 [Dendrobium chrysotoxum]
MLKSLDKKRPDLDSLDALQDRLKIVVGSKKFLLILDDIREEENRDISKREDVLALVACGKFGNRILGSVQEWCARKDNGLEVESSGWVGDGSKPVAGLGEVDELGSVGVKKFAVGNGLGGDD